MEAKALSVVLGSGGVILLLVALVGGGFTFSGSVFPRIGKVARIPCFVIGAILATAAIALAAMPSEARADPPPVPSPAPVPAPAPVPQPVVPDPPAPEPVVPEPDPILDAPSASEVGTLYADFEVRSEPYLDAMELWWAFEDDWFDLTCVVFGEEVTSPSGIYSSDLWHPVGDGYVPDAYVDTGTWFAGDMPLC